MLVRCPVLMDGWADRQTDKEYYKVKSHWSRL